MLLGMSKQPPEEFHFFDPNSISTATDGSTDFYEQHRNAALRIQRKIQHRLIKRRQRNDDADPYQPAQKRARCEDKVASNLHQFHISDEWSRPDLVDADKWFFLRKPTSSFEELERSMTDDLLEEEEKKAEDEGPILVVNDQFKNLFNPASAIRPTDLISVNQLNPCTQLVIWRPPALITPNEDLPDEQQSSSNEQSSLKTESDCRMDLD